jgi:hypothetical protein
MGLEIVKSLRKFGVRTDKIDPEPYFFRWEACLPIGSKDQPELIGQPCYKHKTCGHLVKVPHDRIPPKVCPWCGVDTVKEAKENEELEKQGVKTFDAPQLIVNLKEETFKPSEIDQFLREDDG